MTKFDKTLAYKGGFDGLTDTLAQVFEDAFGASEGPEEGARIAQLFRDLVATTPVTDLQVFSSWEDGAPVACVAITRLRYARDAREVWLLAPVAVRPERQGKGGGQSLVAHALDTLRKAGADIVLTYGDPGYYVKTGFQPIGVDVAPSPWPLSMPQGWQGQVLGEGAFTPLQGPVTCAPAWADPAFW